MKRSLWLGYSIAPLTGPLVYSIAILFFPSVTDHHEFSAEISLLFTFGFCLISYTSCLVIGAPLIYALKKCKRLSFSWLAVFGSIFYAAVIYLFLFVVLEPQIIGSEYLIKAKILLVGAALGAIVTAVFSYLTGILKFSS